MPANVGSQGVSKQGDRASVRLESLTYVSPLCDLVAAYEDEHHAIEPASDADMLRHFMDARGVSQVQLHRDTGIAKSTISEVLVGKRPFSRRMIRKLADYFKVDISVLAGNL